MRVIVPQTDLYVKGSDGFMVAKDAVLVLSGAEVEVLSGPHDVPNEGKGYHVRYTGKEIKAEGWVHATSVEEVE